MPPEFGRKWGTECLKTRFPLPTYLHFIIFLFNLGQIIFLVFFKQINIEIFLAEKIDIDRDISQIS